LWRITCFFTDRDYRRNGVASEALKSGLHFMKERGVRVVEAYPVDVRKRRCSSMLWNGTPELFEAAGFTRVGRLGKSRWVVEKRL
jgi:ribosomal protein S18 acetylase RimI-like enzyme